MVDESGIISNKLLQILEAFPRDRRRSDDRPNPKTVRLIHALTNLILCRLKKQGIDLATEKGTATISFCIQNSPKVEGYGGWQKVLKEGYEDACTSINSIRAALKFLESIGAVVWESQGRAQEGLLHCNVETLLLVDQACMVELKPSLESEQGSVAGDDQLSDEYWKANPPKTNSLRSSLRWIAGAAKRAFGELVRRAELPLQWCEEAIAFWDDTHRIVVPIKRPWKIETELGFSWVDDKWLDMGDPCPDY